jgi:hypothetical protein
MSYLVKNVTYLSPILGPDGVAPISPAGEVYGKDLVVADIPNVGIIKWYPGQVIDLEAIATTDQILQSMHLRVHINEGRMVKL